MDPEPSAMKELIAVALEECTDTDMLDLIYKLLTYDSIEGRAD